MYKFKKYFHLLWQYCHKCRNAISEFSSFLLLTRLENLYPDFVQLSKAKMFTIAVIFLHLCPFPPVPIPPPTTSDFRETG